MAASCASSNVIAENVIRRVVERFYAEVRKDPLLAPVFEAHIADWPAHNDRMCDFWSSIMNGTGRYSGRPLEVHRRIGSITPSHFERWVTLFTEICESSCDSQDGDRLVTAAQRMRMAMSANLVA
jgi:hemoglobin